MGLKESGLRGSLRNVSVGIDAIPDSQVFFPVDEGSGTVISDDNDNVDATLDSESWIEDADFVGGFAVDRRFQTDDVINSNINPVTVCAWLTISNWDNESILATSDDRLDDPSTWAVETNAVGEIRTLDVNSDGSGGTITAATFPENERGFIAFVMSSDDEGDTRKHRLVTYDDSELLSDNNSTRDSGSYDFGVKELAANGLVGGGNELNEPIEFVAVFDDKKLSGDEIKDVYQATK